MGDTKKRCMIFELCSCVARGREDRVKIGVYGKITTELGRGSRSKALTKRLLLSCINRDFKTDKVDGGG
jgi:hypothetical protein